MFFEGEKYFEIGFLLVEFFKFKLGIARF